jgi:hypothetical protein
MAGENDQGMIRANVEGYDAVLLCQGDQNHTRWNMVKIILLCHSLQE